VLFSELFFKIRHRGCPSGLYIGEAALDPPDGFQLVEAIEKFLVGSRILDHHLGFAVDSQNDGVTSVAHLLEEVSCISLKFAEGMDIFADVEHTRLALNLHPI
jgi:hypothetical protein